MNQHETDRNQKLFNFQAYGLRFSSPFDFFYAHDASDSNELKQETDVRIVFGKTPEKLANPSLIGALWSEEDGKYLLRVENVARYLIVGNHEIIIEMEDESKLEDAVRFLMGSVLGVILHQRGIVILRASAIQTEKGAIIFLGFSGSGKTSFLYSRLLKGDKMLADEKTAVFLDAGQTIKALPGYPEIALNADVVQLFKVEVDESRVNSEVGKYYHKATNFEKNPSMIRAVYWLENHNGEDLEITEIPNYNFKFNILNSFIYLNPYPFNPLQKINYFKVFTEIAKSIPMTKIRYSLKINQFVEIEKRIAEDLAK